MLGDEIGIDVAVFDQEVQEPVQQGEVGAGFDLQKQVGPLRSVRAAWVDDDQLGAGLHPVGHPQEQDRVAVGRIGADHEKQVRAVEVGIGAGRSVGAERLLESGACTGHAQPGVRLDVNGAQETLGQFGGEILRLDGHLAGHVQRDGVGSVFVNDGAQSPARLGDGVVDRRRHRLVTTRWPHQCRFQPPVVGGHHLRVGRALRAQPAEVGRMQLVSGYLRDDAGTRVGGDFDAAADTAVRTRRPGDRHRRRQPAGAGTGPTSSPVRALAWRIRRNTAHVTIAQIT